MSGGDSSKKPVWRRGVGRIAVPLWERVASLVILALLAGIGAAVWHKGRHYDPGVYALRAGALRPESPGDAEARPGPSAKAKPAAQAEPSGGEAEHDGYAETPGASAQPAAPSKPGRPAANEPMEIAGFKPMGPTEFYNADNLFEKIDGRAGAYLGFNFQALRCRTFEVPGAPGSFVDVFEYRMDTPMNAFGIYAQERDPQGKPLDFAPEGYSGEVGYYFRQGSHYVQVIASDAQPRTMATALALAKNRAAALPADNTGLEARRRLPAAHLAPGSVAFVLENAQGQAFLNRVFQAKYDFDGAQLPFFVMVTTPEKAAEAWKSYNAFCSRFGKAETLPPLEGAQLFKAQSFGKWRVIYQKGGEIGGVFDAPDGEKARRFVEGYLKGEIR